RRVDRQGRTELRFSLFETSGPRIDDAQVVVTPERSQLGECAILPLCAGEIAGRFQGVSLVEQRLDGHDPAPDPYWTAACSAFRVASRSRAPSGGRQLGAAHSALSGSGWNSRKTPSAPAATAALAITATPSRRPPVEAPPVRGSAPGSWTA